MILQRWLIGVTAMLCAAVESPDGVLAMQVPEAPLPAVAPESGRELETRYQRQLETLRAEIRRALPAIAPEKLAHYLECRAAERAAREAVEAAQKQIMEIEAARELVDHAKNRWIGSADKGIADARARLEQAKAEEDRQTAVADLERWQINREEGLQALAERQARLEQAERARPAAEQAAAEAEAGCARAQTQSMAAIQNLGLAAFLASSSLDSRLAKFVVMQEASPGGLAAFAAQGPDGQRLVDRMLADEGLLLQMAFADGAKGGRYGEAMRICSDIQQASRKSREGPLQRLALAISLEHAEPVAQRNAVGAFAAPATVDPVQRYLHFERAFLAGELDAGFRDLGVWEYRMVVDGEEPDEILAWGRQMLRNYRPDQITTPDYRWRYVSSVRTDVRYGSEDNHYDRDDLQFFQNILMNGGVCGRRAFFGRFILRAFGVPTTARPQKGHAALVHWTPEGWVICLGAGWGSGWTKTRYDRDVDFLAHTQARAAGDSFMQVRRAQWIGDVMGEQRVFGFEGDEPGFWNAIALYRQREIIAEAKVTPLDAVGSDLAEANESGASERIGAVQLSESDQKVTIAADGKITIPAVATRQPPAGSGKIIFMESNLGGKQLHYSRNGAPEDFEYSFKVPTEGEYALRARVVTPSWRQSLQLVVNGAAHAVDIPLPFTVGMWETTEPVEIRLQRGENLLRFSRPGEVKGCTIKDFTLTPVGVGDPR